MRRFITAIIFPLIFPLSFLFFGPFAVVAARIKGSGTVAHTVAQAWANTVFVLLGIKIRAAGLENVPTDRPVIFACNHASQMDILALYLALPVEFRFVVKEELFRIPVLGMAMRAAGYVPINRSGGKAAIKSLREAARRIREGASVVIFPEGTRSPDGRLAGFKPGGFLLASKSGCPIVPVAIKGSHMILPKGSAICRPGTISVTTGKPILTVRDGKPVKRDELMKETWQAVNAMLTDENSTEA